MLMRRTSALPILSAALVALALMGAAPPRAAAQTTLSMEGGARAAALGHAATALPGDVWGFANPASWATLPGRALSFYAGQAFGLADLRFGAAHIVEPTALGAFAGGARTFGSEDFRETTLTLGYARGLRLGTTRAIYVGADVRYVRVAQGGGYGSAGAAGLSLGGLVAVLPGVHFGARATNLNAPTLATEAGGEELPRTLALGLGYAPDERLLVLVDAFKDIDHPLSVRAGAELRLVEALALRAGVTTAPTRFTTGAGLRTGRIRASVVAEQHQDLGWSPAASLGLQW